MRTTDIQIWYKQAYWSQTNYIYKHGFFYNTQRPNAGDIGDFFFLQKKMVHLDFYTFIHLFSFSIFVVLFLIFVKIFNHGYILIPLHSQNAQGVLGADSKEHKLQ